MERYRSFSSFVKEQFGEKLCKLSFDGGFTCPVRDGRLDTRGCIFCSGGSGDFAVPVGQDTDAAFEAAKAVVAEKNRSERYIAYFQSFTGTYAPVERLRQLYLTVIRRDDVAVLDIGTRPDCLGDGVMELLAELNAIKPVWIELGLQTVHPGTAEYIRRGYPLEAFDDAVRRLKKAGIYTVVHMILGLPGETAEDMAETARYIGESGADGIKLQLLHVLKGTDLAADYEIGKFEALSLEEYIGLLERCISVLPPDMTIHRLTGDGAKRDLIAPLWSGNKKHVLNEIQRAFEKDGILQGSAL